MLENIKNNTDVIYKKSKANCEFLYQEHLCNILEFMKDFYPRLLEFLDEEPSELFPGICKEIKSNEKEIIQFIFSGLMIIIRNNKFYSIDLSKAPSRMTNDSIAEPENVMGSRDGFVENIKENISLVRTRVKDDNLKIENISVGRRSKTMVSLLSIEDIHNKDIKNKIIKTIKKIDIDAIISIDDLMSYFGQYSIFPTYHYIGNPDTAVRRFYDGELMIIIDRIPVVIMLPTTMANTSRLKIDSLNVPSFIFLERLFIILSVFISIMACGIINSFVTYQKSSLSLMVLSTLKITQSGVYLPIFVEMLIILFLFELYYLIGFRQSKFTVSSTVVLIGGLIIGQNLISTGVAGVFIMTVTALCFLMSFIISSNINITLIVSMARVLVLFSSLVYGIFGVIIAAILIAIYLYKPSFVGVCYLYPFIPFDEKGIFDFFIPSSNLKKVKRERLFKVKNIFRRKI